MVNYSKINLLLGGFEPSPLRFAIIDVTTVPSLPLPMTVSQDLYVFYILTLESKRTFKIENVKYVQTFKF